MKLTSNPKVRDVFDNYPKSARKQMVHLRKLVLKAASEVDGLEELEETLRWGEPSYLTKHGSTLRMDWKERSPEYFAMYFQCTSRLVPTFRTLYKGRFEFEGNRAIVFKLGDKLPEAEVMHCISLALTYHKVKHLPLLGV